MTYIVRLAACLLLAGALALQGCAPRYAGRPVPPDQAVTEWLAAQQARLDRWKTYQAVLRIGVRSSKSRFSTRAFLMAELPDRLRLDCTNAMGQLLGIFVAGEEGARLYVPDENKLYTAALGEELLGKLFGTPVTPETLSRVTVACVPADSLSGRWDASMSKNGEWLFQWESPDLRYGQLWRLDAERKHVLAIVLTGEGYYATITYEKPAPLAADEAPSELSITSDDWSMSVRLSKVQPAPDQAPDTFAPSYPSNPAVINLDEEP